MKAHAITACILLSCLSSSYGFSVAGREVASRTVLSAKKKEATDAPGMDPAKRAALDGVLNQIERSYGRGSIVKLGDAANMVVDSISSGALTLDAALGGGFPKGMSQTIKLPSGLTFFFLLFLIVSSYISTRSGGRDLWPRVLWKDNTCTSCHCRVPKSRRNSCVRRCRTRS